MSLQSSNLEYYNRMQELEDRLRRSEEERMHLRRQFDLLLQSNQEKERARVSAVEARYKRFLDEDKRRRDRNSSLLQAMDRIDNHTANLAAKTERMRALRKHYEAFLAHSYPTWHSGIESSFCPLAAIAPAPNVMTRVTDITDFDTESPQRFPEASDYSETQYHVLPSKSLCALASPLCRSDLAISSREDCPVVGRSSYRTGSAAIRSASLSPSRVRDLSSQYDANKTTPSSYLPYDVYSRSKSPDVGLSSRLKNESHFSKRNDVLASPRPTVYHSNVLQEKPSSYRAQSTNNHRFLDYDHGNSDIEADQNTSGDLLNLSNLSLSDDGMLNESEIHDLQSPFSRTSHYSYSPRDFNSAKKSPTVSLPSHSSVRHIVSPREIFVPKRSVPLTSTTLANTSPKSILSPRSRKADVSSIPISDSTHRLLFPSESMDITLSPRRQKSSWQTLRPSYIQQAPRNPIRRSVTFIEPEYEGPCIYRDDDLGLYSGSYGSLRRHSPSIPTSSWESNDHERYLREKQGREKDAFREKIERLKELIQENKGDDIGLTDSKLDKIGRTSSPHFGVKDYNLQEKSPSRESSLERDWRASQSRRQSFAREPSSDNEEQLSMSKDETSFDKKVNGEIEKIRRNNVEDTAEDSFSEPISEKEQWSGQLSEKDEDVTEKDDALDDEDNSLKQDLDYDHSNLYTSEAFESEKKNEVPLIENILQKNEEEPEEQVAKAGYESHSSEDKLLNETKRMEAKTNEKDITELISEMSPQLEDERPENHTEEKSEAKEPFEFKQQETVNKEQHHVSDLKDVPQSKQDDQMNYDNYENSYNYEADKPQQEWNKNEEDSSQSKQYSYEQGGDSSTNYEQPDQNISSQGQEDEFKQYAADTKQDQQSYENYQSDVNQQPQMQGDYSESSGYKAYGEPQQTADSTGAYQNYSEDPNQYQQNYQTYPEEQQYAEPQDQTYATQDQSDYQYTQDPNKAQYEYDGQEYNYQQGQDTYNYTQDPNYQQDATYQQDPSYQQDATYQQNQSYQQEPSYQQEQAYQPEQSYVQDQTYKQDEQYDQAANYQQNQQYQETGYEGAQPYAGYQAGAVDDLSEDTTPSADSNLQGPYQGNESSDQKTLEQYRALLGADPSSEPAYSDSSEIENQMAAVVGQTGNSATSLGEPQITTPQASTPPASTPPATTAVTKGKAGPKKKPQLTRKQSSVTPESTDGKLQQAPNLPKTPESG